MNRKASAWLQMKGYEGLSALQRVRATKPLSRSWEGCGPCPSAHWSQAGHPGCGMQGEAAATDAFLQPSLDSTLLNTKPFFLSSLSLWTEILKKFKHVVWAKSFLFPSPCLCLVWLPNCEKHKYLLSFHFTSCHPLLPEQGSHSSIQYHQH